MKFKMMLTLTTLSLFASAGVYKGTLGTKVLSFRGCSLLKYVERG